MEEAPGPDPMAVLVRWHAEAVECGTCQPDTMTLATSTPDGRPAARIVLFKGLTDGQVMFVSSYAGRKGHEIARNPEVALVLFWPEFMRQVRLEGRAARASAAESDAYFRTRPRESQIGAWVFAGSDEIASRALIEQRFAQAEARFAGREVERPPEWGVYRVAPRAVELWLARPHRMHDRFLYTRNDSGWTLVRLCP